MLPAQSVLRRLVSLSLYIIAVPATWNIVSFYKYRAPSMQLRRTGHCCCTWLSCTVLKTQQRAIPCPRGSFCIYCRATGVGAQPDCSHGAVVQIAYGMVRDTRREIQCCRLFVLIWETKSKQEAAVWSSMDFWKRFENSAAVATGRSKQGFFTGKLSCILLVFERFLILSFLHAKNLSFLGHWKGKKQSWL